MRKFPYSIFILLAGILSSQALPQSRHSSDLLAEGDGIKISRAEIEKRAAAQLEKLELERIRFEAKQLKDRHQILENTLNRLLNEKLLELEAEKQGIQVEQLRAQIISQTEEPSDEDIEAFYEKNKNRIKGEKEKLVPQIRNYLKRQRSQQVLNHYYASLRDAYAVKINLEPLRFDVDSEGAPFVGKEDAEVVLVEFSDFECPYCSRLSNTLNRVKENYADRIKLVFRQYPLPQIHSNAQKAAEASLCAADQDRFWEMHDLLFADRKNLKIEDLKEKATELGLDMEQFNQCLDEGRHAATIARDLRAGMQVGITGTPALFINGRFMSGAVAYEKIVEVIEEELADKQ